MPEPKDMVETTNYRGFTHKDCEFFPCHEGVAEDQFNCLFCYCPLQFLECPGPYTVFEDKNGNKRKDCSLCSLPHEGYNKSWWFIQSWLENPEPWKGE